MTRLDTAADRALCEAAIDGPWTTIDDGEIDGQNRVTVLDANGMWVAICGESPKDAAFIAAAHTRWPAALDEVDRLTAELETCRRELGEARAQVADMRRPDEERRLYLVDAYKHAVGEREAARADRDAARAELAQVRAEVERMREVYEAAIALADADEDDACNGGGLRPSLITRAPLTALYAAIDRARSTEEK